MAETKIISVEAVQTIQQLKDNIKELKSAVDTLEVGTDEYSKAVVALAENQRALKLAQTGTYQSMLEVANASKADTVALNATVQAAQKGTATYNEMSLALGRFKQEIKAIPKYLNEQDQALGNINPAYQELSTKIQTLDSALKSLDADNGVFSRNVGNYLGALKEWGGTMGQVQQIGSQLMSGIMALVGVMSMFGVDTDETKESLQALVPVVAVLNGAKAIGGLTNLLPKASNGQKALATATQATTVATKAQTVADGELTVAETAAAAAGSTLKVVLDSLGIGVVITAVVALGAAIAKFVENNNAAIRTTKELKKQQEELNKKFTKQNEELDREQRLKQAQGVSNKVLLEQKKANITAQKNETQALINNVNARLKQMKADSAWVRFWKGENKQIKNLEEQLKELNQEMEGFNKSLADIDIDIQIDGINESKKATQKFGEETKKALDIAKNAIKANRTELDNLTEEYETNSKVLNDAFDKIAAKLNSMQKGTKAYNALLKQEQTIFAGIIALDEQYAKNQKGIVDKQSADNAKKYGDTINRYLSELNYHLDKATAKQSGMERLLDTVLGSSEAQSQLFTANGEEQLKATTATQNLISVYTNLKSIIGEDIKILTNFNGELKNLNVSGLSWDAMLMLSQTDANKLAESVGEPLATAIGQWLTNDNALAEATYKGFEEQFAQGITVFNDLLAQGPDGIEGAKYMREQIMNLLTSAFDLGENPAENPVYMSLLQYLTKLIDGVMADDEFALNFAEKFSALLSNEHINNSFDAAMKVIDDFNKTYVASTADALDAVADLWETSLKWKYKKLVESGKMTEKEAEKQAQAEFKNVKALQIGLAAINTAAAVVSALADPSVPSYYVKAANAIAAGVAGAAQILTISMTDFGKPSVNTSTSTSTPSYTSEPQPVYYSYGINPMDYAEAQSQEPIRAYVVDSDLSDGLRKYEQRNEETTF